MEGVWGRLGAKVNSLLCLVHNIVQRISKLFSVYSLQNIYALYGLATAYGKQNANKMAKKATQKLTLHIYTVKLKKRLNVG
jgi:hypothetical protein